MIEGMDMMGGMGGGGGSSIEARSSARTDVSGAVFTRLGGGLGSSFGPILALVAIGLLVWWALRK